MKWTKLVDRIRDEFPDEMVEFVEDLRVPHPPLKEKGRLVSKLLVHASVTEAFQKLNSTPFFAHLLYFRGMRLDVKGVPVSSSKGGNYLNVYFVRVSPRTCALMAYLSPEPTRV